MKQHTITFEPSEQDAQFLAGQLQEGNYKTQSELIRAGFRRLEEDETRLKTLRRLIDEGKQSGEPVRFVLEDFLADMHKKYGVYQSFPPSHFSFLHSTFP